MTPAERRELVLPALVLVAAIAGAFAAIYYTDALLRQGRLQLSQQEAQAREARVRLHKSGDERDVIVRHLARYQDLQRIGFAGEEQRINWLDGLRLANERADLFGIDYQIAAQAPYAYAQELSPGDIVLHQSVMTIRFKLLHEGDLMRFFAALRDAGAGMFAIDECAVNRAGTVGGAQGEPNLLAECKLSWITARPRHTERQP
jgi:hypothetical protein